MDERKAETVARDRKNLDRVEDAKATLGHYNGIRNGELETADTISDLIADLLHLTAHLGGDVDRTLRVARMHFDAEHGNPEEV